ncbi:MAG: MurR/RpiR family transcriptional regulator [Clostridiales bacterium]|jgi:DNA-binding MurR/RpiR family transcriptional regulator|nr:MurR/RpiR family transcriptional regulator [Clostridiales bacterium]
MRNDLLERISAQEAGFSKSQRRLADYIVTNYDKAAFMTAYVLGKTLDVSESTVVRFATELGYEGYPQMQRALRELANARLTTLQRIELTGERLKDRNILRAVMESDAEKIRKAIDDIDEDTFNCAVRRIIEAKHIYIIGIRSSSFLAEFLGFYLDLMLDKVTVIGGAAIEGDIFERLFRVGEGDLIIGFSFPRYSRRTLRALRFALERNADVISITDSRSSPISELGDCTLYAPSEMASFVDSFVAPLSLINALIISVGMEKKDELSDAFEVLEEIWKEYGTYEQYDNT